VVGARPNFMKIAPLLRAFRGRAALAARLIHTGQHFSPEMSDVFFDELGIGAPDVNLEIGAGTPVWQTAEIMKRLDELFAVERPDLVLVVGDVNSTLAAALVASKNEIRLAHVEAGLRSFDRGMPEEINRIVTDSLSDYLFVTEPSGVENLQREGVAAERIFLTGNVMIDTLFASLERARRSDVLERLGLRAEGYALATLHRPSNVDEVGRLRGLVSMLSEVSRSLPVVFSVHPRTKQRMEAAGIATGGLKLTPPLGYMDFLRLTSEARLVLTDSGGIQEETSALRVPCLTLRENTERPVTTTQGSNRLIGTDPGAILAAARQALSEPARTGRTPDLWDGQAAERIAAILERLLAGK
jgi:UDP-N-acetylglucosamine 2-epimerase (non-hydrolysing)